MSAAAASASSRRFWTDAAKLVISSMGSATYTAPTGKDYVTEKQQAKLNAAFANPTMTR